MAIPLTDGERTASLVLAGAGAVVFVASLHGSVVLLAIGLVMTGALAAAAFSRHRVATAIASFVTAFGPWGFGYILGAPFLVLAFLLVRAGRQVADDRGTRR